MRRYYLILLSIFPLWLFAQHKASTQPMRFDMDASSLPSILYYVDGSLRFEDQNQNNTIDANERCFIIFKVVNKGDGDGRGCEARIRMRGNINGIVCEKVNLPKINHLDTIQVRYPLQSNINTENGKAHFSMEVYEPNGFGTEEIALDVPTHKYDPPRVEIVSNVVSSSSNTIQRKEKFSLKVMVQNIEIGTAEDVITSINLPSGISLLSDNRQLNLGCLKPNESVTIEYELIPTVNAPNDLDFDIVLQERYGRYAQGKTIHLKLGDKATYSSQLASTRTEDIKIRKASLISDVDENIPVTTKHSDNTFVLVIANQNYQQVAHVPFALNDGNIFKQYCVNTLGINEKHIKLLSDATYNQLKSGVNWLAFLTEAFDNPQIIVYYAGHGFPNESNKSAYLLPVDGSSTDVTTGYKLDELYATLGNMPASQITVFLDACFSGSKREDGMLASARGVALKVKSGVPQGNMVVFSAAQGDETAYPLVDQQHGLFTYYLLKKLKETKGDVTLEDLGDYIITNVRQQSIVENGKSQTPAITASSEAQDWQTWKLK